MTITFINNWKKPTGWKIPRARTTLTVKSLMQSRAQLAQMFINALESRNLSASRDRRDKGKWLRVPLPGGGVFPMPCEGAEFLVEELVGFTNRVEMAEQSPAGRKYGLDFDGFDFTAEAVPAKDRKAIPVYRKLWAGSLEEFEDFLKRFDAARS